MGADVLVNSGKVDAAVEVKKLTEGRGADAVFFIKDRNKYLCWICGG